jgi:tetratricopeptide (TPR) repeat protein
MKKLILIVLITILSEISVFSQTPQERYAEALKSYSEENYATAAEQLQYLYNEGYTNFEVCYNLGNAYYKTKDVASAILYYERAKQIKPNNNDVNHNIEVANKLTIDKIETIPEMFYTRWWNSFTYIFTPKTWIIINVVLLGLFLLVISSIILSKKVYRKKVCIWISLVLLLLFIVTTCVCVTCNAKYDKNDQAIVFTQTRVAKSSPTESSIDLFVVHRGTKVRINDKVGDWIEIVLSNGKQGWIKEADVQII